MKLITIFSQINHCAYLNCLPVKSSTYSTAASYLRAAPIKNGVGCHKEIFSFNITVYSICMKILVSNRSVCDCKHFSFLANFNCLVTSTSGVVGGMVALNG